MFFKSMSKKKINKLQAPLGFLMVIIIIALFLSGCRNATSEKEAKKSDLTQMDRGQLGAIDISSSYIDEIAGFIQLGEEYKKIGMQIQSKYAYGYAAASVSSMRLSVDTLLHIGGEGVTLAEVVDSRKADWDEIAAYNYASPYPYLFEGLTLHAQGKTEEAQEYYHNAALNPEYDIENGDVIVYALASLNLDELKTLKLQLIELEDEIYEAGIAEPSSCPRDKYCFSDSYLTALGQEELKASD